MGGVVGRLGLIVGGRFVGGMNSWAAGFSFEEDLRNSWAEGGDLDVGDVKSWSGVAWKTGAVMLWDGVEVAAGGEW